MATDTSVSIQISDEDKKIVNFVVGELERYEEACSDRFDIAEKIYDHWLNKNVKREEDWQNNVHVPMTFEAEQTISPRIHSALFPTESPVEMAVFGDTTEAEGILVRDLIRHHFRISDVQGKSILPISQCTLLGTGYFYAPWVYKTNWMLDRNGKRYMAVTDNRPDVEPVGFFEILPHPAKLEVDDGLPMIRRRFCDQQYLKRLSKMPQFKFKNLSAAINSECPVTTDTKFITGQGNILTKPKEQYEIVEYWGPWDETIKNDDGSTREDIAVPFWIMVINRKIVIRAINNPYNHQTPPFIKIKLYEDINPSWFGIGIGQVGKPCQERLNKIVNQRLDNVDLVLNKQGFYNGNDPLINTKKLQISKPGVWRMVSDTVTSIRWMDTPDVTASSYQEEKIAKEDYRESTGATVPLMPTDGGQHRTASGINLLQGAAGMRFRPILSKMENDLIGKLAHFYLMNLQQFMTIPEWIQVTADKMNKSIPLQVSPEILKSKVKFIPTGLSEVANKEYQIQNLLKLKEVSQQDPTFNRAVINRKIAELMGFKDLDELIVEQKPIITGPGANPPDMQAQIAQRVAEGASPEQIKMEMIGQPPAQPNDAMMAGMST